MTYYRTIRLRLGFIACGILLLLGGILSCAPSPDPEPLPDLADPAHREHVRGGEEYRNAVKLAAGRYETVIAADAADTLRIGILPSEEDAAVQIEVRGDGWGEIRDVTGNAGWHDVMFDVGPGDSTVAFASRTEFYLAECTAISKAPATSGRPNVLLIMVDTLRPDRMSCYGYEYETTPHIDAMAEHAAVFETAVAQSTWTRPTTASTLTSTYPGVHGAEDRPDVVREGLPSLAETLRAEGYATTGIVTNVNLQTRWGFGQDFDRYLDLTDHDTSFDIENDQQAADETIKAMDRTGESPWFIYTHFMAPHGPYAPPIGFNVKFQIDTEGMHPLEKLSEMIRSQYDGEIGFVDSLFGEVVDALRERGLYDDTIIVFVSDHGEQFHEHGINGHGFTLYDHEMRIPLLIKPAGGLPHRRDVNTIVEQVDIAPTILELAGIPSEPRFAGRSLVSDVHGGEAPPRLGFAQLRLGDLDLLAVRSHTHKYIRDAASETGKDSFFDLVADPGEQTPLPAPPPEAQQLIDYALQRSSTDAAGLHVLFTDVESSNRRMTVEIGIPGVQSHNLQDPGKGMTVQRDGDAVVMEGRMRRVVLDSFNSTIWAGSTFYRRV
jgi:arylsulfatase A-like enzyme